jgi:ElaB/YqjD/DUF883 family membrane-anchored ribosome-binding protein
MSARNAAVQQASKEKLIADFEALIADTEELLGATANQGSEKLSALRERMSDRLSDAKSRLIAAERSVVERTKAAARDTDAYVQENPWQSVLVAGGVGFLLGFIATRLGSSGR